MADVKFFFLVAGFDYERIGLDFRSMCTGRVRERIQFANQNLKSKDAWVTQDTTLRFLRFSAETGKVEVIDKSFRAGRGITQDTVADIDWGPLSSITSRDTFDPNTFVSSTPFRAIKDTDYQGGHFQQSAATRDVMSIVDVYHAVLGAPGGSVLELSFFSHAWVGGPILVNSTDTTMNPRLRDPGDKDGRARVDFGVGMGEPIDDTVTSISRIFRFMAHFDPKGIMRVWGCDFDVENYVIQETLKRIKVAGDQDDVIIQFDFEDKWTRRYGLIDPGALFLPADPAIHVISRTFKEMKAFLRRRLKQSYAFQFAASGFTPALGALPGTEGDDEKSGFFMMQVCALKTPGKHKNPECPNGFAPHFNFYKKYIGIDVGDRGYAIFDAATTQKITADIAVDERAS